MKKVNGNEFVFDMNVHAEKPTGVSKTIAGDSYGIREILEKYTKGIPLNVWKEPVEEVESLSFDSVDIEEFQRMDYAEQLEVIHQVSDNVKELEERKLRLEEENKKLENARLASKKFEEEAEKTKEGNKEIPEEASKDSRPKGDTKN